MENEVTEGQIQRPFHPDLNSAPNPQEINRLEDHSDDLKEASPQAEDREDDSAEKQEYNNDSDQETSDDEHLEEYDCYDFASTGTRAGFQSSYACYSLSKIGKPHLEQGDQIIMPQSAFNQLMSLQVDFPMLFEIRNDSEGQISHCGVYEFTADEGSVFLPNWMMMNLHLEQGEIISLESVNLEKGTYIKIQPHSVDFLSILNPKAALEESFSYRFFCLTVGDTIKINHNNKDFFIDIVDAKPSSAVCILDTDCEVDFAPPLDYKEPVKPAKQTIKETESLKFVPFTGSVRRLDGSCGAESTASPCSSSIQEKNHTVDVVKRTTTESVLKFIPFTGSARRLDGKPGPTSPPSSLIQEKDQSVDAAKTKTAESEFRSRKRPAKLLFGSSQAEDNKSKELNTEIDKTKTPKKQEFQPFTGKRYKLGE